MPSRSACPDCVLGLLRRERRAEAIERTGLRSVCTINLHD